MDDGSHSRRRAPPSSASDDWVLVTPPPAYSTTSVGEATTTTSTSTATATTTSTSTSTATATATSTATSTSAASTTLASLLARVELAEATAARATASALAAREDAERNASSLARRIDELERDVASAHTALAEARVRIDALASGGDEHQPPRLERHTRTRADVRRARHLHNAQRNAAKLPRGGAETSRNARVQHAGVEQLARVRGASSLGHGGATPRERPVNKGARKR